MRHEHVRRRAEVVGARTSDVSTKRHLSELDSTPQANVFPGTEPKTVRLSLSAGEEIPPHRHPDRHIVLYLLEGRLDLVLDDSTHELDAGDIVRFDGDRQISPKAVTDATALLVLASR
nr:cupin domain-containing protein [Natronomonas sp. CBA1123]